MVQVTLPPPPSPISILDAPSISMGHPSRIRLTQTVLQFYPLPFPFGDNQQIWDRTPSMPLYIVPLYSTTVDERVSDAVLHNTLWPLFSARMAQL